MNQIKNENQAFSNAAFVNFLVVNYWVNESGINLTNEDYKHILDYLQRGNLIDSFNHATKEVKNYCLKYSLFDSEEPGFVRALIKAGKNEVDVILEKYSKLEDSHNKTVYRYLLLEYIDNPKRQLQILSFQNYQLMILCFNIIFPFEFPDKATLFKSRIHNYEKLLMCIPENLKEPVKELLSQNKFDELISLLHTEKVMNDEANNLAIKESFPPFQWEEKVIKYIKNNPHATKLFAEIIDEYSCDSDEKIIQKALTLF